MEGLFTAQEQALSTNAIKAHIYSSQYRCQLCGGEDETINQLVSCCSVLVQNEYKPKHDRVVFHVQAKQAGLPVVDVR